MTVGFPAAAMLAAALWRIRLSFGHMMWLDELYTTTLIGAPNLGHLWDGAMRGVDGNPPLYLSLAWLLTSAVPLDPERVLRPLNLVILAATAVLMYRLGRRMAAPMTVAAVLATLPALDEAVKFALLELRTYALYLFLVTASLDATLSVVDRPRRGRTISLAGIGVLAALSHSFAGFYVLATIGSAGLVCLADGHHRATIALALAAIPTSITLLGWIALSLLAQMAVASPYGWISRPDAITLLEALTGSGLLSLELLLGLVVLLLGSAMRRTPSLPSRGAPRDIAVIRVVVAAYVALTLAGWVGSQIITPFFVPRYFAPNLLVAVLLLVPAVETVRRRGGALALPAMAVCALLGVWKMAQDDARDLIPCFDADGRFLEQIAARGGLPVVATSPHAWLPRSRYAPDQTTLFPLDWAVVLHQPNRARNNATDFHIMDILRGWAPQNSALATRVLTTDEILARDGHFLLLDELGRGWFDELRARVPVSARLLGTGPGCRLWEVDVRP